MREKIGAVDTGEISAPSSRHEEYTSRELARCSRRTHLAPVATDSAQSGDELTSDSQPRYRPAMHPVNVWRSESFSTQDEPRGMPHVSRRENVPPPASSKQRAGTNHRDRVGVMEWRDRLVDTSCAAVNAASAGDLPEAYRCALMMISFIHEIEFHEGASLGLAAVMEQVLWAGRSSLCSRAA